MTSGPKILIIIGLVLLGAGLVWALLSHFGVRIPFGRLPGDIAIEKENVRFYFPVATSILLSLLLSLILYLVNHFKRN